MVEGFQKTSKVYDSLMKSGKFTALQNKEEEKENFNSIGQLVSICEAEGFIPCFYDDNPNDKVDATIADLKGYTKQLIYEEMNLGNLIEQSLKTMMTEESKPEDDDLDDVEQEIFAEKGENYNQVDYNELNEFLDGEDEIDEELYKKLRGEI